MYVQSVYLREPGRPAEHTTECANPLDGGGVFNPPEPKGNLSAKLALPAYLLLASMLGFLSAVPQADGSVAVRQSRRKKTA